MKILIFSDSHGDQSAFDKMLKQERDFDRIYCLGDSGFDLGFLKEKSVQSVRGNYPFAPKHPLDILEKIHNFNIFLTHGHLYHVKLTLNKLISKADFLRVDLACFGHTHKILLLKYKDLILLNPGALSYKKSDQFPSYARLFLDEKRMKIQIINLSEHQIVKEVLEVK